MEDLHLSTMEDLRRQLEQLRREKEQAEARADQERQEKEQAEARADQERREKEQAQRLVRNTTLEEYLRACHEHVLSKIVLVTDGYLTSKAPTTNPTGKHCPDLLTPWADFLATQVDIIQRIARILPSNAQLFENIASLKTIGDRVRERRVTSESSLVFVENNCIEDPVRIVLSKLKDFSSTESGLDLFDGVYFETTASNLRDETDGRNATNRDEKLRTDQICVFRNAGSQKEIAYVIEYKAPHKLHTTHFEQGLRRMSIFDEVVNRLTIPTAEPEKFQYYAERLSAAALTQTYHYMLEAGLEYGYVTNGDAIVFLKINWANPKELLYHLAQPLREVAANDDPIYSNAVCQVLAFTLLALQSSQHDNDERTAATNTGRKWEVDFDSIVDAIVKNEEKEAQRAGATTPKSNKHRRLPSSPDWQPPPVKKTKRSPQPQPDAPDRVLRSHNRRGGGGAGGTGGGGTVGGASQSHCSQDSSDLGSTTRAQSGRQSGGQGGGAGSERRRPYCTPSCLLSLVNGWPVDSQCPNVLLHANEKRHPVSFAEWRALLQKQLAESLVKGVVPLGEEGACGALFQLTLLQYGYTFVAKGVTGRHVPKLQHEEAIYQKLQPLQGRHIPVCLGSMDLRPLRQVFFYDFDVRIIYFLFLSYGGSKLSLPADTTERAQIVSRINNALDQMHRLGVAHSDVRLPNVLQDAAGHITLIDFDQASVFAAAASRAMSAISHNKRKRLVDDDESTLPIKMRNDKINAQGLWRQRM